MLYRYKIDKEKCIGCERCVNLCPHKAIAMEYSSQKGDMVAFITDKCLGCGECVYACGKRAIRKTSEEVKARKSIRTKLSGYFDEKRRQLKDVGIWLNTEPTLSAEEMAYYFNNRDFPMDEAVAVVYLTETGANKQIRVKGSQIMFATDGIYYTLKNNPREFAPYHSIVGAINSVEGIILETESNGRRKSRFIDMEVGRCGGKIANLINGALEILSNEPGKKSPKLLDFNTLLVAWETRYGEFSFLEEQRTVTWTVFRDGTFEAKDEKSLYTSGTLKEETFAELKFLLNTQPWGDPAKRVNTGQISDWDLDYEIRSSGFYQDIWGLEYFNKDGRIIDEISKDAGNNGFTPIFNILKKAIGEDAILPHQCMHTKEEMFRGYLAGYNLAYSEMRNAGQELLAAQNSLDELLGYVVHLFKSVKHFPRFCFNCGMKEIEEKRNEFHNAQNPCCHPYLPIIDETLAFPFPFLYGTGFFGLDEYWVETAFGANETLKAKLTLSELLRNIPVSQRGNIARILLTKGISLKIPKDIEDEQRFKAALLALAGPDCDAGENIYDEDIWDAMIESVQRMNMAARGIRGVTNQVNEKRGKLDGLFKEAMPCSGEDYTQMTEKEKCSLIDVIEAAFGTAASLTKKADCSNHYGNRGLNIFNI